MIVKNESKIITRLFDSIINIIDFYVICDTGSSDDTINIIRNYFDDKKIRGCIFSHEWRNFGYNRDVALQYARQSDYLFDYILFLDADMKLIIDPKFNKNKLSRDVYNVKQGDRATTYMNVRLVKKDVDINCVGVTHEYYNIKKPNYTQGVIHELFINDIGDGGSKSDKFDRDIRLLTQGLIDEPGNQRYLFYLAQSYFCNKNFEKAIEFYLKRIIAGGWNEELYISSISIGHSYRELNDTDNAIYFYAHASKYNSCRLEGHYEMIRLYREKGKYSQAQQLLDIALSIKKNNKLDESTILFHCPLIYSYKLDYELSIISFYGGYLERGIKVSDDLIFWKAKNGISNDDYAQVRSNLKFYVQMMPLLYIKSLNDKIDYMTGNFRSFLNPSICMFHNQIIVNVRNVNYNISEEKGYEVWKFGKLVKTDMENPIRTRNFKCLLNNECDLVHSRLISVKDNLLNYPCHIKGIEDMRIFEFNESLYFIGTCLEVTANNVNRMVLGKYNENIERLVVLHNYNDSLCQKNWSPFVYNNKILLLYSLQPIVILEPNIETGECKEFFKKNHIMDLSNIRGGSQGFWMDSYLYFVMHEVVCEKSRTYYHRIVRFNENLEIDLISRPFYFESIGIEYCSGACYDRETDRVIISWGSKDKIANISEIEKDSFIDLLVDTL
jgi:tetratricopeptide (TPR) repeat protein